MTVPIFRKDGKNILFIHVPKTGGSTIETMFRNSGYHTLYRDPKTGPESVNKLRKCSPQHMHADMLEQTFNLEEFDAIFMITRDPVARFRSEYGMRNAAGLQQHTEADVERWADTVFRKYAANRYVLDNHLRPQRDFYIDGCRVYRLEDGLDRIVEDVNARFGLSLEGSVPKVMDRHSSSGVSSRDIKVSADLERRIKAFYYEDFSRFGYPL
jgi:hypothetical protein